MLQSAKSDESCREGGTNPTKVRNIYKVKAMPTIPKINIYRFALHV